MRRTGVATSSLVQSATPNENSSARSSSGSSSGTPNTIRDKKTPTMDKNKEDLEREFTVEGISLEENQSFFKNYIYVNGVTGFRESFPIKSFKEKLIRCPLYPLEKDFQNELKSKFDFCQYGYCGKCEKLKNEEGNPDKKNQVILDIGINLHSWRYFNVSGSYNMLEADLNNKWWPVEILKGTTN